MSPGRTPGPSSRIGQASYSNVSVRCPPDMFEWRCLPQDRCPSHRLYNHNRCMDTHPNFVTNEETDARSVGVTSTCGSTCGSRACGGGGGGGLRDNEDDLFGEAEREFGSVVSWTRGLEGGSATSVGRNSGLDIGGAGDAALEDRPGGGGGGGLLVPVFRSDEDEVGRRVRASGLSSFDPDAARGRGLGGSGVRSPWVLRGRLGPVAGLLLLAASCSKRERRLLTAGGGVDSMSGEFDCDGSMTVDQREKDQESLVASRGGVQAACSSSETMAVGKQAEATFDPDLLSLGTHGRLP